MRNMKSALLIGILASAVVGFSPASATPLGSATGIGLTVPMDDIVLVQGKGKRNAKAGGGGQRAGRGGGGGQRAGRGGGGQRFGGGGGGRGRNIGTGLAIGAGIGILGGIAADRHYRNRGYRGNYNDAIRYCMENYPNYDPNTEYWYDGRGNRYPCP